MRIMWSGREGVFGLFRTDYVVYKLEDIAAAITLPQKLATLNSLVHCQK